MVFTLWFCLAILFHVAGVATVLLWRRPLPKCEALPSVSVLKPLKGCDSGLQENLESFFQQEYPQFELLFSISDPFDPARKVVENLKRKYPDVTARLIVGDEPALNPKVGNLIRSYRLARYDLLLISDSNVRVRSSYLKRLAAQMRPNIGVITSLVAGVCGRGIGGALEAAYLNTFYARGLSLAFLLRKPCVVGKSMMFRRSDMEKFGGMESVGGYVAEDFVIGERMCQLGLKVRLATDPIEQHIGEYSFGSFWARHVRWGRIRKNHAPFAFFLEPLLSSVVASFIGAKVAHSSLVFLPIFLVLGLLDSFVAAKVSQRSQPETIFPWMLRELLSLPMWIVVASGNQVSWRGHRLQLQLGGKICEETEAWHRNGKKKSFSGGPQLARTKWRGRISRAIGGNGKQKAMLPEA